MRGLTISNESGIDTKACPESFGIFFGLMVNFVCEDPGRLPSELGTVECGKENAGPA